MRDRQSSSQGGHRERERERERERQRETQNPKQAPSTELSAQSPMQGWNPQTARLQLEPKSDAQPTEPPTHPPLPHFLNQNPTLPYHSMYECKYETLQLIALMKTRRQRHWAKRGPVCVRVPSFEEQLPFLPR